MSKSFDELLDNLRHHWVAQGVQPSSGATDVEIRAFEVRRGCKLAQEVRSYFKQVNGVVGGRDGKRDRELLAFWNLNQVEPAADEAGTVASGPLLVFADWSLSAHDYAFRADAGGPGSEVFLIGGRKPEKVASSLGEFLRGYMAGNRGVLFGA